MARDLTAELVLEAESLARDNRTEAVTVLFASRDDDMIRRNGPRLARKLWPDVRFGDVIWHEPVATPEWADPGFEWSEVAVEVKRRRDLTPTAGAVAVPSGSRT